MDLTRLTALALDCVAYGDGNVGVMPGLSVLGRSEKSDLEAYVYEPVLCLILQGSKRVSIGEQDVEVLPGNALLVSHDLPVLSRITRASAAEPYLALILTLDLSLMRGLRDMVGRDPVSGRSLSVAAAEAGWLAALIRYMEMKDAPLDAQVLGPDTLRELHYRLLVSPLGGLLRGLLDANSQASRIAAAIGRVRSEFRSPISVPDLARTVGMSASSFHEHFKAVTGTTPLQYQKALRLTEAKSMLLNEGHSVAQAAFAVGYESPTQFSRDYRRKFGVAPSRDGARQTAPAA